MTNFVILSKWILRLSPQENLISPSFSDPLRGFPLSCESVNDMHLRPPSLQPSRFSFLGKPAPSRWALNPHYPLVCWLNQDSAAASRDRTSLNRNHAAQLPCPRCRFTFSNTELQFQACWVMFSRLSQGTRGMEIWEKLPGFVWTTNRISHRPLWVWCLG